MRNLKKVLGLVLCLAMMLSIMVVGAGAAFNDQSDIDSKHTEAVDMCVALNIIDGFEDGSFKPTDNVTREQMAKMICVLDNGGKEPQLAAGNTFTDVPSDRWSNKYVESCNARGVVSGVGDNKFDPASDVTATQAAKMLLVELGYKADIAKYEGDEWATYVNIDATKKGYYTDLEDLDVNAPMSREHAAQMIWNALQAVEVEYKNILVTDENGNLTSKVDVQDKAYNGSENTGLNVLTLLMDKYGAYTREGTLAKFDYNAKDNEWTYTVRGNEGVSASDYTDLYGQNVKMVLKPNDSKHRVDTLGIFAKDSVVLFSGVIGDLPKLAATDKNFKFDDVKYKLDNSTVQATNVYFFTHDTFVSATAESLNDIAGGTETWYDYMNFNAIDDDDDGKIDFLMVFPVFIEKVANRPTETFKLVDYADPFTLEDVTAYDGMAKDDYVVWTPAENTKDDTDVFVKANLVAGDIDSRDDKDITLDGTPYTIHIDYIDRYSHGDPDYAPGTTLIDAVEYNGYIFDADARGTTDVSDYAVVVAGDNTGYGSTVKLLFSDGTKKVVDLKEFKGVNGLEGDNAKKFPEGDAAQLVLYKLFVYETNKDEEYTLTSVDGYVTPDGQGYEKGENNKTGFDFAGNTYDGNVVSAQNNSSTKAGFIDGYAITDDSVIFIRTRDDTVKVITGAAMKAMKQTDFTEVSFVIATKDSKTNVANVDMAYVSIWQDDVKSSDTQYGYVTSVVEKKNDSKEDIYSVTIWTADGEKKFDTVKPDGDMQINKNAVGKVVEYTVNSDSLIDTAKLAGESVAILSMNDVGMTFDGSVANGNVSSGKRVEFDDNVAFIFVDASEDEGATGYDKSSILFADKNDDGIYVKNAYVVFDSTSPYDILAVVYDVDNAVD